VTDQVIVKDIFVKPLGYAEQNGSLNFDKMTLEKMGRGREDKYCWSLKKGTPLSESSFDLLGLLLDTITHGKNKQANKQINTHL